MVLLVRPGAWWHAKVPLSILLFLLLAREYPLTFTVYPLVGLLAVVCCVGNFGFAINDLFDQEEDLRANKPNAATLHGPGAIWVVVAISAALAIAIATYFSGWAGGLLTFVALLLPLGYSVPPLRFKERHWLGVVADALAAHVFPAVLAILIVTESFPWNFSALLIWSIVIWAAMAGLRNILAHQMHSMEIDQKAGLDTVVHKISHEKLFTILVSLVIPVEATALILIFYLSNLSIAAIFVVFLYIIYEMVKTIHNVIVTVTFSETGCRYIPFVDESLYKVWGPVALLVGAGLSDPYYLLLIPIFAALFWELYSREYRYIRRTAKRSRNRLVAIGRQLYHLSRTSYHEHKGLLQRSRNQHKR